MPISIPYHDEKTTNINEDQRIATKVDISTDGKMHMTCEFWNDKRVDGDHYASEVFALNAENKIIAITRNEQGLNARFLGKATYKTGAATTQIPVDELPKIEKVIIEHCLPNRVDDKARWEKAGIAVGEIFKWFGK